MTVLAAYELFGPHVAGACQCRSCTGKVCVAVKAQA